MQTNEGSIPSVSCLQLLPIKNVLLSTCYVCGGPGAEQHFGGDACRACAAFFRRCCRSEKSMAKCSCEKRKNNSHPCRSCRIKRCLEVGMVPEKVDKNRCDRSENETQKMMLGRSVSLLLNRMILKDTPTLSHATPNWNELLSVRDEMTGGKILSMNLFELSSLTKTDIILIWRMITNVFPSVESLKKPDKEGLLRNFHLKLWLITTITFCMEKAKNPVKMKQEEREHMIVVLYDRSFKKGKDISRDEILKLFGPFWWWLIGHVAPPILQLNLAEEEVMAIIWLLFFDHGYTNISSDCNEICRNIKKVIMRQLKKYQNEQKFDETRFLNTLEVLGMFEKLEKRFVEEMMFCEINGLLLHDDFREILMENKF